MIIITTILTIIGPWTHPELVQLLHAAVERLTDAAQVKQRLMPN